jgi:hypothetical protein
LRNRTGLANGTVDLNQGAPVAHPADWCGSSGLSRVSQRLFRRIGVLLLAIAFLGGGLPGLAMATVGPAAAMASHMHAMHVAPAADHHPRKAAPDCQHSNDCLACAAFDIPATILAVAAVHWIELSYRPGEPRLAQGMMPPPELFPPIRQS